MQIQFSSAVVLAESKEIIFFSIDYDETISNQDMFNSENSAVDATGYRNILILAMKENQPNLAFYFAVNPDGTLAVNDADSPNMSVLMSMQFFAQSIGSIAGN